MVTTYTFRLGEHAIFVGENDDLYLSNVELLTILDRILDKAADNLRFAKILIQLGLDPDNVTYDAIFNRLLEIFLANITIAICVLWSGLFSLLPRC